MSSGKWKLKQLLYLYLYPYIYIIIYIYMPTRKVKFQSNDNTKCQQKCGPLETPIHY